MPATEQGWHSGAVMVALFVTATTAFTTPAGAQYVTRPAPFRPDQVETVQVNTIKGYAGTLSFDSTLGASDLRLVYLNQDARTVKAATLVWIQPEKGSHRLTEEQLKSGRIIARIWSDTTYDRLGLKPGWTWWWVGEIGGALWSVFISEREGTRERREVTRVIHKGLTWSQAIARLVPDNVGAWTTCGGCCKS